MMRSKTKTFLWLFLLYIFFSNQKAIPTTNAFWIQPFAKKSSTSSRTTIPSTSSPNKVATITTTTTGPLRITTKSWDALEQKLFLSDGSATNVVAATGSTTSSTTTNTMANTIATQLASTTSTTTTTTTAGRASDGLLSNLLKSTSAEYYSSNTATSAATSTTTTTTSTPSTVDVLEVVETAKTTTIPLGTTTLEPTGGVAATTVTTTTTTTPEAAVESLLDQTSATAQSVLDSVKELSTLRSMDMMGVDNNNMIHNLIINNNYPPVTTEAATTNRYATVEYLRSLREQTLANVNDVVTAGSLPDSLHELETKIRYLLRGAPPGEGIAKPMVEYVMTTLYGIRDSPYNPPHWVQQHLYHSDLVTTATTTSNIPVPYGTTTPFGLQINSAIIQTLADVSTTTTAKVTESKERLDAIAPYLLNNWEQMFGGMTTSSSTTTTAPFLRRTDDIVEASTAIGRQYQQIVNKLLTSVPMVRVVGSTNRDESSTLSSSSSSSSTLSISTAWKESLDQLALVQTDMERLLRTPGWRPEDLLTTLHLKELGPFYVGIAATMLLALSYNNNMYQQQQQQQRMIPPTNTTTSIPKLTKLFGLGSSVSQGANTAVPKTPSLAMMSGNGPGMGEQSAQLENIVADLTQATAILATEMKGMAAELRQLKQQQQVIAVPTVQQSTTAGIEEVEMVPTAQQSSTAVAAEVEPSLMTRPIIDIQPEDELAKMLRELEAQNELLRIQLSSTKLEADTLSEVNEALNAGVEALASISKEPMVPQGFPSLEELGLSDAYFIAGAAAVSGNGRVQPVQQQQQFELQRSPPATAVMEAPDWSNLSLAALKRKTEAELQDYLARKGLPCRDDTGRPLPKTELLVLVMSIA